MEGVGSFAVAEALLVDNSKLKMELQECQGTVSKLKAMLKQSRLRIKELEAENYERKVDEEIEKELTQFQVESLTKTAVKQENIEPNLPPMDPVPVQVNDLVSELDSFINRMNQTKGTEKQQHEGEELLAEDLLLKETVEASFTLNRDKLIKRETVIETSADEDEDHPSPSTNVKTIKKCTACEKEFSKIGDLKQHEKSHKKSDDSKKPTKVLDQASDNNKMSKLQTSLSKHDMKKAMRKNFDRKYECNKCEYKHVSPKAIKFHIMNKHEGVTWDCTFCSHKSSSPYQLQNHVQIKHKAYRTEATMLKETTTKTVKVRNIQQILDGSTQIIATTIKEKDAKINESSAGKLQCPFCDVQSTKTSDIKSHIETKHEEHSPLSAEITEMFEITEKLNVAEAGSMVREKVGNMETHTQKTVNTKVTKKVYVSTGKPRGRPAKKVLAE